MNVHDTEVVVTQKILVKTRPRDWFDTVQPVIVPLSIHSSIYQGREGSLKIAGLLNLVKSNTKGKKTILICDRAHIYSLSLKYENDVNRALEICKSETDSLIKRFEREFQGFEVLLWTDFVSNDPGYIPFKDQIQSLYETNDIFRKKVNEDAAKTYNAIREKEYSNKSLYIQKTELDLLEQCVYLLIASENGYKFEFYPGKRYESAELLNSLNTKSQLTRINVTLKSPKNSYAVTQA